MKKHTLLLLLVLLLIPVSTARADDTAYQTQGEVGFTGTWETPKPTENPEVPLPGTWQAAATPTSLPRTGDSVTASMATSAIGVLILLLITVYNKLRRKGVMTRGES
ncbi:hypothetical protein FACS1894193_08490 [Bacilli bacterium]|nr:hypothetical protein FACS1894192_00140 [Bacilli bacterium]GHU42708.1 hypothetical protein FACS1894193_08490 [Bacilli bacterium]